MADAPTDPAVAAALRVILARRRGMRAAFEGLGDDGLNWKPGADTNSIYSMLVHTFDTERVYLSLIAGPPVSVETDFARIGTAAELLERMEQADSLLRETLAGITDLARETGADGRMMPVAVRLGTLVAHAAEHMAHAQLTRQLWDQYGKTGVLPAVE